MRVRPDMSSCEQTRRILWPLDRPRGFVGGEEDARVHLRECAGCQAFFAADTKLTGVLGRYGGGAKAPPALRARVLAAIVREERQAAGDATANQMATPDAGRTRRAESPGRGTIGLIAATVLLAAIPVTFLVARDGSEPAEDLFVQDYLRRAVEENVLESPDAAAVSHFFMSELGVAVTPAQVKNAEMTRAMVCLLRDRRAAMVEYRVGDHTVAHYMLPRDDRSVGLTALLTESQRGVQVAAWSDDEFEHVLVSDLPESELAQLAGNEFAEP
jgi:anti-sigma factor RsiW